MNTTKKLFFLLFFIWNSLFSQNDSTQKKSAINEFEYTLKFGTEEEYEKKIHTFLFDTSGNLIEKFAYSNGEMISSYSQFFYDENKLVEKLFCYIYYENEDTTKLFSIDSASFFNEINKNQFSIEEKIYTDSSFSTMEEKIPIGNIFIHIFYTYDEAENLIEISGNRIANKINENKFLLPSTIDKILEIEMQNKLQANFFSIKIEYENSMTSISLSIDDIKVAAQKLIYDKNKNLIEKTCFGMSGAINEKQKFIYKKNKVSEASTYDSMGKIISKSNFVYDKNGNEIENIAKNFEGKILSQTQNKFDTKNNLIEKKAYSKNGKIFGVIKFKYENKNLIEQNFFPKDTQIATKVRKYKYAFFDIN